MTNEGGIISRQVVERVTRTCATCGGSRRIISQDTVRCWICGHQVPIADLPRFVADDPETHKLPCGHPVGCGHHEWRCPDCGGAGVVTTETDITAAHAMMVGTLNVLSEHTSGRDLAALLRAASEETEPCS